MIPDFFYINHVKKVTNKHCLITIYELYLEVRQSVWCCIYSNRTEKTIWCKSEGATPLWAWRDL